MKERLDLLLVNRGLAPSREKAKTMIMEGNVFVENEREDKAGSMFDTEATSALDTETEAAVMEAIDSLQGKMTMLIIAHRLSTIKNCDMVYQVEGGSVTRKEKESV